MISENKKHLYDGFVFPIAWSGADVNAASFDRQAKEGNEKVKKRFNDGFSLTHISTFTI